VDIGWSLRGRSTGLGERIKADTVIHAYVGLTLKFPGGRVPFSSAFTQAFRRLTSKDAWTERCHQAELFVSSTRQQVNATGRKNLGRHPREQAHVGRGLR
jgi:hypothetical protein